MSKYTSIKKKKLEITSPPPKKRAGRGIISGSYNLKITWSE
jgi:hypothetical protein